MPSNKWNLVVFAVFSGDQTMQTFFQFPAKCQIRSLHPTARMSYTAANNEVKVGVLVFGRMMIIVASVVGIG